MLFLCHLKQLDDILKQQGFRFTRTFPIFLASIILVGCSGNPFISSDSDSILRDKSLDYAQSEVASRILVPQNLNDAQVQNDLLFIPAAQLPGQLNGIAAAPRPNFVFAEVGSGSAHFTGDINLKKISVAGSLAKVQGQLAQFWSNEGISIETVSNEKTVETQWFSLSEKARSNDFISRWIRGLTKSDNDIVYGRVKIELNEISQNRVELSLYFLHFTKAEITQNKVIDWQEAGRKLANESEITFELLRYLSHTSLAAQKVDENSLLGQTPLLGKDQYERPLVQLNMSYSNAFPKVLKAMSVFDVGSYDEIEKKIFFTYVSHSRSLEKNLSESGGIWGWIKGFHSGSKRDPGIKLDFSLLGADEAIDPISEGPVYSSDASLSAQESSLADKEGYKVWMGGEVVYVFEDENQGVVSDTGEYTYTGEFQLSFQTTLNSVYLQVLNNQGQPAAKVYAEEILWELQQQLTQ